MAANWLALQGTETGGKAGAVRLWGFLQLQYQEDDSEPNPSGAYVPLKLIGPDFDSQADFNVNRARIGVRGVTQSLDPKINYFLLVELGNNGITEPEGSSAKLADASMTFNHLDGARIRVGLFKHPGAEEAMQSIHVFDYINFTWVTQKLLLERFPNRNYTPNNPPTRLPPEARFNAFTRSVGAFHDVGVQVFDWLEIGDDWEWSYAAMIGNGNGLDASDNDDNKDLYLYTSFEKVYGGKGPRREGLKLFAWSQSGKRTADLTADACVDPLAVFPVCGPQGSGRISTVHNPEEYDRDRMGVGFKYLRNGWRASAEYMRGEGMIWQAPQNASFGIGPGQGIPTTPDGGEQAGNGALAEGTGWYVEGGWRIPKTKWELDLRYDEYKRLDGNLFEIEFTRTTIGVQYFFNPRVRLAINYEAREAEAVNFASGAGPNVNADGIDDRIAIQLTGIWSQ